MNPNMDSILCLIRSVYRLNISAGIAGQNTCLIFGVT